MNFLNSVTNQLPKISGVNLTRAVTTWVGIGAVSGGFISGCNILGKICSEPRPRYHYPFIEKPIRGVYYVIRIATHTGSGAFIGGFTALTAPVSIPLYILCHDKSAWQPWQD